MGAFRAERGKQAVFDGLHSLFRGHLFIPEAKVGFVGFLLAEDSGFPDPTVPIGCLASFLHARIVS